MTPNEYHLITFDPGSAATGWAWFVVDFRAFSRPDNRLFNHIKSWDCGEFQGSISLIQAQCVSLMREALALTSHLTMDVVCEGFELTQIIGGKNLISPVVINSVIEWEARKIGIRYTEQSRTLRTNVTRSRLKAWGFEGKFRKDEFSAMQHAIVWLRRTKERANKLPWKLADNVQLNARWDCACSDPGYKDLPCDIWHPQQR